jgi:hypothetical protein
MKPRTVKRYLTYTVLMVVSAAMAACGGRLATAPRAPEPNVDKIVVDSLPPPALPEEIPALGENQSNLVWTDGCWEWSMGRWVWVRGGWVDMPQGGAYFPGRIGVGEQSELLWTPCAWFVGERSVGILTPKVPARYPASARSVAR